MIDNNLWARPFSRSKGSRSQLLQTTNPLYGSPNLHGTELHQFGAKAFTPTLLMSRI